MTTTKQNSRKKTTARAKFKFDLSVCLQIIGVVCAIFVFIAVAFNFLSFKYEVAGFFTKTPYKLGEWFTLMRDNQASKRLGGWKVARVFLIIDLVLTGILLFVLVFRLLNYKTKVSKIVNWCSLVVGILALASALGLLIAMIAGCGTFSVKNPDLQLYSVYRPGLAVYVITFLTIATAVLAQDLKFFKK